MGEIRQPRASYRGTFDVLQESARILAPGTRIVLPRFWPYHNRHVLARVTMRISLKFKSWTKFASKLLLRSRAPRKRKQANWDYLTSEPLEQRCVLTVSQGWAS